LRKESGGKLILDTSFLIELLDRGRSDLVAVLSKYTEIYIPWVCLYEYLYGHKVGRNICDKELKKRKENVEFLGSVLWCSQEFLLRALGLDYQLSKKGLKIPFSDLIVATFVILLDAKLATFDRKHFGFIENRIVP